MMKSKYVRVMQVVLLFGALVAGGPVAQSYAQGRGQEPVQAARQALAVPEIIDALVSFPGWDCPQLGNVAGPCLRVVGWGEIRLSRQGADEVKAMSAYLYYPVRISYQTLKVTGPLVRYITTVNVCGVSENRAEAGCDSIVEWTIEVVSKTRVNVTMKVLRGGSGAGVATGQICSASFNKK